ncbi:putative actin patch assembly and actin polymerization protein [Tulasnella sp. 330]|nr:putative actin patch assembly and actin polymerization protein [Tulasnella sp. 330]KAG8879646.1 putative actin patch assembly and actin polymerization protein [Tulasnella sp. 331]
MSKSSHFFGAITGLNSDKPHSSITDWIEILSSDRYTENDLDGIPELVDSINLQPEGPTEAARAIRKKLKYGNVPRQIRALTILKALVENAGPKFQSSFANDALINRIKAMATDPHTDGTVKKKLMSVLGSWYRQFKDDPKMSVVAGLWAQCGGGVKPKRPVSVQQAPPRETEDERATRAEIKAAKERAAREEEQERARREAERKRKEKEEKQNKKKGVVAPKGSAPKPFDFEKEKPLIITSIANASQASIHLNNALKLVNREQESIETNARVQECLANAKQCRKVIVRYIQRVENEEVIGTLLDVNERIISSLQLYDTMLKSAEHDSDEDDAAAEMASLSVQSPPSEISKLQGKQRMAIERANSRSSLNVNSGGVSRPQGRTAHPDLNGLSWGEQSALPPPLRPRGPGDAGDDAYRQGSLSDYSDYSSEEEERSHPSTSASSHGGNRDYRDLIGGEDELIQGDAGRGLLGAEDDDPFADPFGDGAGIPDNLATPMMEKRRQDVEL